MSFARRSTTSLLRYAQTRLVPQSQRRHARVLDVRFVTTQQPSAAVLEKYRAKLEQKAKQEGLKSVSELKEAYKDKIEEVRKEAAVVSLPGNKGSKADAAAAAAAAVAQAESAQAAQAAQTAVSSTSFQQPPPPPPEPQPESLNNSSSSGSSSSSSGSSNSSLSSSSTSTSNNNNDNIPGIKPLSSYIDVSKVKELPAKEIEYIWRLRFASDPLSLCAVVPLSTYQRMQATARQHPQFILPLPRPEAAEAAAEGEEAEAKNASHTAADVHFLQWGFHPPASGSTSGPSNTHTSTVIFTHLAAFKLHGAYAEPHTTITHHLDLADSHGIVLLNGGVVKGRGVSVEEGRWLLMCLQRFYDSQGETAAAAARSDKRYGLLEKFSKGDASFSLDELVDEAERIG